MREHCVNLAGFGSEVGTRHYLAAVIAGNLVEQAFELADISVYRLHELAVRPVLLADVVECLLALQCIEPARENVAFTALVAVPKIRGGVVVDHASDVDRE